MLISEQVPDQQDGAITSAIDYYAIKKIALPDIVASSAGGLNKTSTYFLFSAYCPQSNLGLCHVYFRLFYDRLGP